MARLGGVLPPTGAGGEWHKNIVLSEVLEEIALEMAVNGHIED